MAENAAFDQRIFETLSRTEQHLYIRFGYALDLSTTQLADFMGYKTPATVHTLVSAGTFPIPTFRRGKSRYASLAHVARYQESIESEAVANLSSTRSQIFGAAQGTRVNELYGRTRQPR